jgi:cytochrome c553
MRAILATIAGLFLAAPAAEAADAARGLTLYQTYCSVCHGLPPIPGVGPLLAPNNPALIQAAINGLVPQMSVLSFLSADQLADIAAYIGSLSSPPPPPPLPPPPPPPPPPDPVPTRDYTDLWYGGESQSGWGFNVMQHGTNVIFGVMYTYDASNRPLWFVLPGGSWVTSTRFVGKWYRVTGPAANGAFDSSRVKVTEVGTAELEFTDATHGTLAYTVNGVAVTRPISRQPF